jgi:hypothetical protein
MRLIIFPNSGAIYFSRVLGYELKSVANYAMILITESRAEHTTSSSSSSSRSSNSFITPVDSLHALSDPISWTIFENL